MTHDIIGRCSIRSTAARPTVTPTVTPRARAPLAGPGPDPARTASEAPRSRYSRTGHVTPSPEQSRAQARTRTRIKWPTRPGATAATRPATSLSQLWTASAAPYGRWPCSCPRRDDMDSPYTTRKPDAAAGRAARQRVEVPLFGPAATPARRLAHRTNAVWHVNGTATPTAAAILGEDSSGSTPVGSALNTYGSGPCVMR